MSSSSPAPKLPMWIFFATDVVLLGAAVWIARQARHPMPEVTSAAIVACIIAGAIAGLVPLIVYYERQKNETLDDRQRALEALARTVSASAEQISIAASGLHEIADIAQKNLRHAEQLPQRLQEKIAEFQAQLANASETDREELEKELEELRASETERLQSISDRIARTTGEFAKLESATHQHLIAANEAVSKLSFGTASAIGKAQAAAEQALGHGRQEVARNIGDAEGAAIKAIEAATKAGTAELAAHFENNITRLKETAAQVSSLIETLRVSAAQTSAKAAPLPATGAAMNESDPASQPHALTPPSAAIPAHDSSPAAAQPPLPGEPTAALTEAAPPPVKRTRKARREEHGIPPAGAAAMVATEASATPPVESAATHTDISNGPLSESTPAMTESPSPATEAPASAPTGTEPVARTVIDEPLPVRPEAIAEVAPVAPPTAEPFHRKDATHSTNGRTVAMTSEPAIDGPASTEATTATETTAANEPVKPARKRAPKKAEDDQPGLGLELEESSPTEGAAGMIESVLSSDGATRLIVTAYIGIGNRLFIRGSGPGLSWEKGVALQFVSIGKWRWETNDASAPVQFKLFKNDEQESASLGTLTIEPGHQQEVTANFG